MNMDGHQRDGGVQSRVCQGWRGREQGGRWPGQCRRDFRRGGWACRRSRSLPGASVEAEGEEALLGLVPAARGHTGDRRR